MSERLARVLITALALSQLAVAAGATFAPHSFFKEIADFGAYNAHFVYDYATFSAAVGIALLASVWLPSLRRGALLVAVLWSGLHALNHVLDYSDAATTSIAAASLGLLVGNVVATAAVMLFIPTRSGGRF